MGQNTYNVNSRPIVVCPIVKLKNFLGPPPVTSPMNRKLTPIEQFKDLALFQDRRLGAQQQLTVMETAFLDYWVILDHTGFVGEAKAQWFGWPTQKRL